MNDSAVKPIPGVQRRPNSTFWHLYVTVPTDLAHHFKTQWAHRRSLRTRDLREANDRARLIQAEWVQRFDALRKQDNPRRVALSPDIVAAIAAEVRRLVLLADENMRRFPEVPRALAAMQGDAPQSVESGDSAEFSGLSDSELSAVASFNRRGAQAAGRSLAGMRLGDVQSIADTAAGALGWRIDWSTEEGRDALRDCLSVYREAWGDVLRRDAGEVIHTPAITPLSTQAHPSATSGLRIGDALRRWESLAVRKPKTVSAFHRHVAQFKAMVGDPVLSMIDRGRASKFAADLQRWAVAEKKTKETADNVLASIKALAGVAVREGWIESNPFAGLAVQAGGKETEQREPWTPDELPALFASPIFTAYSVPASDTAQARKAGLDAAYWVPLLCLYSGARPGEVCQLWTDDLSEVKDKDGKSLLVVEFRANPERGQSLKNPSSWRALPVHSELIRLGLADYWRAVCGGHAGTPGPLFPAIPTKGANGPSGQFGQWFGAFKTAQGFGAAKALHSFRHTLETELGFAEVTPTIVDAITGHEGQGIGRKKYGATIRRNAVRLRPHLERLHFPGLVLPRVFTVPAWTPSNPATSPRTRSAR